MTYPAIPDLPALGAVGPETVHAFGMRAFAHVLDHGTGALDLSTLERAYQSSLVAVASPDLLESTRERYHGARLSILASIDRARVRDASPAVDDPILSAMRARYGLGAPDVDGGTRVPVHPGPSRPPSPDALTVSHPETVDAFS